MGRTYFACLRGNPRARVVAVCDRDPELRAGNWLRATGNITPQAGDAVDLAGISACATPEELIRNPAVDVVAVTLPTPLHVTIVELALAAGKHVLCEKPMALDLAGCDRMIRAAEQAQRTLMVGQCVRFWPQYETIQRLVSEGRVGKLRFVKLQRLASAPTYSSGNWLLDGACSGGALLDLHVHDVDFAYSWLGVPETIHAGGCRGPSGEIDHIFATYGYPDGRFALLEGSWIYHAPWPFQMTITVCGEAATLNWSSLGGAEVLLYAGGSEPDHIACVGQSGWQCELDYFIDCVADGRPVARCLPTSTRTSIALALLGKQSIESGGVIHVTRQLICGSAD